MMEYDLKTIAVQIAWKRTEGFWLWASDDAGFPLAAEELRRILFGRHRRSFFGTILEIKSTSSFEAILLDSWSAVDYWQQPATLQYASVDFGKQGETLRLAANWLQRILAEGWFKPELSVWSEGTWHWAPVLPADQQRAFQTMLTQVKEAGIPYVEEWLHGAVAACIDQVPEVEETWARILDAYPALRTVSSVSQLDSDGEEQWLEEIGLTTEPRPFAVSLQLAEPEDERGKDYWKLQFRLKDRENGEWTAIVGTDGILLDGTPPETWLGQIPAALGSWTEKALKLVPELAEPESRMQLKSGLTEEEAVRFLTEFSLSLAQAGLSIWLPGWWGQAVRSTPRLKAKLQPGMTASAAESLFGLKHVSAFQVRLALGGKEYSEEEMAALLQTKRQLVKLHGQWIFLDPVIMAKLRKRMKRLQRQGLSSHELLQAAFMRRANDLQEAEGEKSWEAVEADAELLDIDLDDALQAASEMLMQKQGFPLIPMPAAFQGELRSYQRQGASWLAYLFEYGLGGCLADDMGLGKTIQWIAYFLHLKETGRLTGPSLLICPTSVLGNWQKELERFAPSLRVRLHHGPERQRGDDFAELLRDTDLFLTSYALAHMDREEFSSAEWCCLCLDEAQNVKNSYTKQAQAIRTFRAKHRVALTGTPIENRLTELWSIMDFLNPHYLGSNRQFTKKVVQPLEKTNDPVLIGQVQRWVQPFLLRRVKKEPAIQLDLPDKQEFKTYVTLTAEQAALYESVLNKLFDSIEKLPPMERRGTVLAALTRLKQVCGHPALLLKESPQHVRADRSQKLVRLLEMVQEVRAKGERCLIFTQFVEMGEILKAVLQQRFKEEVLFLYGGVPKQERDRMIERFQDGGHGNKPGLFVLSLKAGGTGLNLTGANHVFHYDRWWNPAVENQATDRAYRIGQTREVQVHKMIALGTLEERIDEMIDRKQEWSRRIVGSGESWVSELSDNELKSLFELRQPLLS
ncbi:ATP-dependent helicase [Xylanibacillus composti]|uniref:Putative ATP-dependent helicase YwqA n=1 Tax=Xylanibacillus composti TaxID=1572762 RepID=A0A8J4M0M6_9BACL|nr:DEAD/DEAH box helicase [Xylanibacillus composti]MDT9725545.1 ATP-dependent helicase [Xylanibacillus composti]GIQ67639.1 putative ATP-dependent helicase YwqA [Xylanibacillus composti]